jgi:hypothetical protein
MVDAELPGDLVGVVCAAVIDDENLDRINSLDLARQIFQGQRQSRRFIKTRYLNDQFHD